jgi:diadenosine tetraphosphate (Ap4A) HIT family hydrolase
MPAAPSGDWRADRIGSAVRGENPMVIAQMRSGFAVIGDTQFIPGYCVLLASPQVASLEALSDPDRAVFLEDMGRLGQAVNAACAPRRINYSIYGNTDAFLHAHVFPRYDWEPAERIPGPVWLYPRENWSDPATAYDEGRHGALRARIAAGLAGPRSTSEAI